MTNEPSDAGSNVQPETGFTAEVNVPGWVTLYTRDGVPHMLREDDAAAELAKGELIPIQYDLDSATSDCVAAHLAAADAVMKAVAEIKATGGQRDEDGWIIATALGKARDAGNHLQMALGAIVPTEAFIAALKEHELQHGAGGSDEFARVKALITKHRPLIDALSDDRLQLHRDRAASDVAAQSEQHA